MTHLLGSASLSLSFCINLGEVLHLAWIAYIWSCKVMSLDLRLFFIKIRVIYEVVWISRCVWCRIHLVLQKALGRTKFVQSWVLYNTNIFGETIYNSSSKTIFYNKANIDIGSLLTSKGGFSRLDFCCSTVMSR